MKKRSDIWIPAVVLIFLFLCALAGMRSRQLEAARLREEAELAAQQALAEAQVEERVLLPEQTELLQKLYDQLEAGDYAGAADQLNGQETEYTALFYGGLMGKLRLYRDGAISRELEGYGIVMTGPGTVFLGKFSSGMPQGECLAFQAAVLDAPRYDYSRGSWENGKMNGAGRVGYCYYQGLSGAQSVESWKDGIFREDLLSGEVMYWIRTQEEITADWKVQTEEGKTVLDDRWNYDEERGIYQLLSETNQVMAYAADEKSLGTVQWKNMILWGE